MRKLPAILCSALISCTLLFPVSAFATESIATWKDKRDQQVVKQNLDYSCGASSLATILTFFYRHPKTEQEVLHDMSLDDAMASFSDLAEVSSRYGFKAQGVKLDYESLSKTKIPVIVYLKYRGDDHFSVVRFIDAHNVHLADPSWGNRILTRKQFEKLWYVDKDAASLGRVLLILPTNQAQKNAVNHHYAEKRRDKNLFGINPILFHHITHENLLPQYFKN